MPNSKDSFNYKLIKEQLSKNADDSSADNGIFSTLPFEVIFNILRFLNLQSLGRMTCVSKSFKVWVDDDCLWLQLIKIFSPAFNKGMLNKYKKKYPNDCLEAPLIPLPIKKNLDLGAIAPITNTPLEEFEELAAFGNRTKLEEFLQHFELDLEFSSTNYLDEHVKVFLKIINFAAQNKDSQVFPHIINYFKSLTQAFQPLLVAHKKLLQHSNNRWILLKSIRQEIPLVIDKTHLLIEAIDSKNDALTDFLVTFVPDCLVKTNANNTSPLLYALEKSHEAQEQKILEASLEYLMLAELMLLPSKIVDPKLITFKKEQKNEVLKYLLMLTKDNDKIKEYTKIFPISEFKDINALHMAISNRYWDLISFLVKNVPSCLAELNAKQETPLLLSFNLSLNSSAEYRSKYLEVAESILLPTKKLNPELLTREDSSGKSALRLFIDSEKDEKNFQQYIVNFSITSAAILLAISSDNTTAVTYFAKNYPKFINSTSNDSAMCPLHLTVSRGHLEFSKILLEHDANPNVISNGNTPLHTLLLLSHQKFKKKYITEFANLILSKGGDPTIQNDNKQSPIDIALMENNTAFLAAVIQFRPNTIHPEQINHFYGEEKSDKRKYLLELLTKANEKGASTQIDSEPEIKPPDP